MYPSSRNHLMGGPVGPLRVEADISTARAGQAGQTFAMGRK